MTPEELYSHKVKAVQGFGIRKRRGASYDALYFTLAISPLEALYGVDRVVGSAYWYIF